MDKSCGRLTARNRPCKNKVNHLCDACYLHMTKKESEKCNKIKTKKKSPRKAKKFQTHIWDLPFKNDENLLRTTWKGEKAIAKRIEGEREGPGYCREQSNILKKVSSLGIGPKVYKIEYNKKDKNCYIIIKYKI
jgi:hypothetical protein